MKVAKKEIINDQNRTRASNPPTPPRRLPPNLLHHGHLKKATFTLQWIWDKTLLERIQFSLNESAWVNGNMLFSPYLKARHFPITVSMLHNNSFTLAPALSSPFTFSFSFFVNIFLVNIFRLFFGLKSSAKEPRQKEAYHGDKFTRDENSHHHLR